MGPGGATCDRKAMQVQMRGHRDLEGGEDNRGVGVAWIQVLTRSYSISGEQKEPPKMARKGTAPQSHRCLQGWEDEAPA